MTSTHIEPVIPSTTRHHRTSVSAPSGSDPRGDPLVPDLTRPRAGPVNAACLKVADVADAHAGLCGEFLGEGQALPVGPHVLAKHTTLPEHPAARRAVEPTDDAGSAELPVILQEHGAPSEQGRR